VGIAVDARSGVAGGGCLRNLGTHGIDLFLHLTGEDAQVAGAQISSRALGKPVEDYASVLLRTPSGIVGTIEVGNDFPGQGADGEWKLAGRDALLLQENGVVRCVTAKGEEQLAGPPAEPLNALGLRDTLARWQSGRPPAVGVEDSYRAARVIDQAYELARRGAR
jgi:predicted dehydrogenase